MLEKIYITTVTLVINSLDLQEELANFQENGVEHHQHVLVSVEVILIKS